MLRWLTFFIFSIISIHVIDRLKNVNSKHLSLLVKMLTILTFFIFLIISIHVIDRLNDMNVPVSEIHWRIPLIESCENFNLSTIEKINERLEIKRILYRLINTRQNDSGWKKALKEYNREMVFFVRRDILFQKYKCDEYLLQK